MHVVPGVEDDQHVRVAGAPVPGGDQPGDDLADLGGGDLGLIVIGAEPNRVQHRRPAAAARFQRGDEGVLGQPGIICAFPLPRPYTWQNIRSGLVAAPGRASC